MHVQRREALPKLMLARYYSANTARFLSVDPVNGKAKSPQSWNRYAYVGSNPLAFVDPDGEERRSVSVRSGTADRHRAKELIRAGIQADNAIANNSGSHLDRAHRLQAPGSTPYDIVLDDSTAPGKGRAFKIKEGGKNFGQTNAGHDIGTGDTSYTISVPTQGLTGPELQGAIEDTLVHEVTELAAEEAGEDDIINLASDEIAREAAAEHRLQRLRKENEQQTQENQQND